VVLVVFACLVELGKTFVLGAVRDIQNIGPILANFELLLEYLPYNSKNACSTNSMCMETVTFLLQQKQTV